MDNRLYTIQEVANILGVSTKTLRRWDQRGRFVPTRTAGNQRRYTQEQILEFKTSSSAKASAGQAKFKIKAEVSIPEPFFKPQAPKEFKPIQGLSSILNGLPSGSFLKNHFLLRHKDEIESGINSAKLPEPASFARRPPAKLNTINPFKIGFVVASLVLVLSFAGAVVMTKYNLAAGLAQKKEQFVKFISNLPRLPSGWSRQATGGQAQISFVPQEDNQAVLAAAEGTSDLILNVNVPSFFSQSVGIGTTTISPSAILDIASEDKGFLAPRMTVVQRDAIVSPATGLFVYNTTTNQYNMFDGTVWKNISGGAIGDVATGDAFTKAGTQGNSLYFHGTGGGKTQVTGGASSGTSNVLTFPDTTGTFITTGNLTAITKVGTIGSGVWNGTTITVANGGTGATTLTGIVLGNGSSVMTGLTTSLGISGAISDETGTGLLVFNTNPLFAGNVTPTVTSTSDLGSSSLVWNNVYANNFIGATSGTAGYWQRNSNALSPTNITDDLLLGATSTTSAKFGFLNVAGGSPTATIAGNLSLIVPTTAGANTFNLLNNSTLNFQRSVGGDAGLAANSVLYLGNNGNVGIGNTSPGAMLSVGSSTPALVSSAGLITVANTTDTTSGITGSINTLGGVGITKSLWVGGSANTAQIFSALGTALLPGYSFQSSGTSDPDTGMWSSGANTVNWSTGGSEVMRIDSSQRLGIGNTSPTAELYVSRPLTLAVTGKALAILDQLESQDIFTASASGSPKFVITNAGNVGIANMLPLAQLDITGSASLSANLSLRGSGTAHTFDLLDNGTLNFRRSVGGNGTTSTTMYLQNDGNVGIGTTAPTSFLLQTAGSIGPNTTDQYNLGSSSLEWNNVYAKNLLLSSSASIDGFWQRTSGALSPTNITDDLLLGATSTTSAKFGFLNVAGGSPTATIAGNLSLIVPTTAGANTFNLLNNSTLNFQRSVGGDAGLAANSVLYLGNNGNVGIGNTAPGGLLTLANNGWFSGASTQSGQTTNMFKVNTADQIQVGGSLNIDGSLIFPTDSGYVTAADFPLTSAQAAGTANGYTFRIGSTNVLTVYGENNGASKAQRTGIGIGITAPIGFLNISGQSVGKALVNLNYTGSGQNIFTASASGTTKFIIDGNGNVGIGNTTPLTVLDVTGSASLSANLSLRGSGTAHTFNILDNGTLNFTRSPGGDAVATTSLFIQGDGNVGIGNTSPGAMLSVGSSTPLLVSSAGLETVANTTDTTSGTTGSINTLGGIGITKSLWVGGSANTAQIFSALGTALLPGYSFQSSGTSDPDTGMWSSGANTVNWSTGGSEVMRIDSSQRLGIGNTSPTAELYVSRPLTLAVTGKALAILDQLESQDIFTASASGSPKFVITNAGNVGIANMLPLAQLDITGSASLSANLSLRGSGTAHTFDLLDNGTLNFRRSVGGNGTTSTTLYLQNDGNVGIGTTVPSTFLLQTAGSIGPNTTDQYNLGSSSLEWNNIYVKNLLLSSSASIDGFWQRTSGALSPTNITDDLLLGATSTTSAKFGFLNVAGGSPTATISGNLSLAVPTGNAPAATLNLLNNGTLNITRSPGGNVVATTSLFIQGDGNVGIGTTSPKHPLEVWGTDNSIIGNSTANSGLELRSTAVTANAYIDFAENSTSNAGSGTPDYNARVIYHGLNDGRLGFAVSSAGSDIEDQMVILPSGNVGIGITAPVGVLQVNGIAAGNAAAIINNAGSVGDILTASSSGSPKFVITNAGNVGIANMLPLAQLDITGSASLSANLSLRGSGTAHTFDLLDNGTLNFRRSVGGNGTTSTTMYLQNDGNVGIGNTAPGAKLEITGNLLFTKEAARTISVGDSTTANTAGGALTIQSGSGVGNGTVGGNISITAGAAGNGICGGTCVGGSIGITSGAGGNSAGNGGDITLTTGNIVANGGPTTGSITIQTASPPSNGSGTGGNSGSITIQSQPGGNVTFGPGGAPAGTSGTVTLRSQAGGNGTVSNNGGAAGLLSITGGDGGTTGTAIGGAGAGVTIGAGAGGAPTGAGTSGAGGALTLSAGSAGVGSATTGAAGGAISLTAGAGAVALNGGAITLTTGAGGASSGASGALTLGAGTVTGGSFGTISLKQGANTRMFVDATGNVGIGGQTSPLTALDVTGSASLSANLSLRGSGTAHTFNILDNGTLNFTRSPGGDAVSTTSLFIQGDGNVGIGNTSPGAMLSVGSSTPALVSSAGLITVANTTDTTSGITGSINTLGGVGITKSLWVGGSANTAQIFSPLGSALLPGYSFQSSGTSDPDTGMWSSGANTVNWSTGGSEVMRIDSSQRLGIGNTSPTAELYVSRPLTLAVTGKALAILDQLESQDIFTASASGSPKFVITNAGNVGIANMLPLAQLDITGSASLSANLSLRGSGTAHTFDLLDNGTLNFRRSVGGNGTTSTTMYLQNDGNVGIGTTGPGAKLEAFTADLATAGIGSFKGASDTTVLTSDFSFFRMWNTDSTNNNYARFDFVDDQGNLAAAIAAVYTDHTAGAQSASLAFGTRNAGTWTEKMRINNAGNVGIGNTTPLTALDVTGSASLSANLSLRGSGTAHTFNILQNGTLNFTRSPGGDAVATTSLFIQGDGNVGIGNTAPGKTLDITGTLRASSTFSSGGPIEITTAGDYIRWASTFPIIDDNTTSGWVFTAGTSQSIYFATDTSGTKYNRLIIPTGTGAFNFNDSVGATKVTIDNTGNVGIGNTTPLTALDVTGSASLSANLSLRGSGTAHTFNILDNGTLNFTTSVGGDAVTNPTLFISRGSAAGAGNVGIGLTAPTAKLEVSGGINLTGAQTLQTTTGNLTLATNGGNGHIVLSPNGTGNVGIGTTNPLQKLHVAGDDAKIILQDTTQDNSANAINGEFAFGYPPDASLLLGGMRLLRGTAAGNGYNGFATVLTGILDGGSMTNVLYAGGNGNVGIGTVVPMFGLDVQKSYTASAAAQIFNTGTGTDDDGLILKLGNASATVVSSTNHFLSFETSGIGIVGSVQGSGGTGVTYATSGIADFAEYFKKDKNASIPFGSVVCFNDSGLAVACDNNSSKIIGVASEHPAFLGGENLGERSVPVGLVGQVRTRVSTANGAIKIGDPLTTSGIAGVAVKATQTGQILGKAIEPFDPSTSSGQAVEGNILVSVNISWYNPSIYISYDGTLAGMAATVASIGDQLTLQGQTLASASATLAAKIASDATAADYVLAADPLFNSLNNKVTDLQSKLDLLSLQFEQQASISAYLTEIVNSKVLGASTSAALSLGDVELNNATINDNLMVLGRTTVSDLGVTGNINAGILAIHGLAGEINTLSGDLKLQSEGLGGVDILNGKVVIDTTGNITTAGSITADEIKANNYTVLGDQSIGSASISAGLTFVEISTPVASSSSKIFLTSTSLTDKQITVISKKDGKFKVAIPSPTSSPITFDWWIVGNK